MRFVIVLESTNPQKRGKKKKRRKFPTNLFSNHKSGYIFGAIMREKKKKKNSLFVLPKTEKTNSSI